MLMAMRRSPVTAVLLSAMTATPQILVHGHRGARAVLPENTIPAFEYAISQGVDALELDLAVTRDNVLVVSHDPSMNPAFCSGPQGAATVIRQMTLAELRQWDCGAKPNPGYPRQRAIPGTRVPTLDDVLALAPRGRLHFNIETKIFRDKPELTPSPEEFARLVYEAVAKHKLETRVILQSFDFRTLEAMKKLSPRIRLSALFDWPAQDLVKRAQAAEAAILSPQFRHVDAGLVTEAHRAGLQVIPWTPNEPVLWDKLIAAGVDAIITDDPAGLIAYLRSKGLRR
jgi:glycerophosphoryl diester phosphodiesterase